TTAESDEHWTYLAATVDRIRTTLGQRIRDAIECAPTRLRERTTIHTLQVTECVKTKLPKHNFQDAVISVDIGPAREFAETLFPGSAFPVDPELNGRQIGSDTMRALAQAGTETLQDEHLCFTLRGASFAAIKALFPPQIYNAIEKSRLRTWEKDHQLHTYTDCVTMVVRCEEPYFGTIHLRLEF
ncbi:hypothetical protein BKA58DRAFT_297799, partial [Alternaria rosae]|uniref:uncharacterized protein n=1 Tax=Alternaria rosae TaxID=1187941 RepID=UPI001E8EE3FC